MQVLHSDACVKQAFEQALWVLKWPDYCKLCGGWGSYTIPATRMEPQDGGPCECVEQGKCPRCASMNTIFIDFEICDWLKCDECGWDELAMRLARPDWTTMVRPEWECWCEEEVHNHEFLSYDGSDCVICGRSNHVT